MPLTLTEALAEIPNVLGFVQAAEAAISALPAPDVAKPSDYIKMATTILNAAGPLADAIEADIKS